MSFGFKKIQTFKAEAIVNAVILSDAMVRTLNATGDEVNWDHPQSTVALSINACNVAEDTGMVSHGGEIWKL